MLQEFFLWTFNLFNIDFIFVLQGSQIRRVLKKKIQKELCIHKDLIMATFPCKSNKRRQKLKKKKKKKNQYLAHMTKTLVICKKYTYYKIKFAHYYL